MKIAISGAYAHEAYAELRSMADARTLPPALYVLMRRLEDAIDEAAGQDVPR